MLVIMSKTVSQNGLHNVYVGRDDGRKVAAVWGGPEERYDLAYQFAASSSMLDSLEILVSMLEKDGKGDTPECIRAKAAIAEAKGPTPPESAGQA